MPKPNPVVLKPEAKQITLHRDLAKKAFAQHRLTQTLNQGLYRSWRCAKPGSGIYGFDVTTIPGSLFVVGDIGSLIVSREADMIPWCRKAIDDVHYFASKVSGSIQKRGYDSSVAAAWVDEQLKNEEGYYSDASLLTLGGLRGEIHDEYAFKMGLNESGLVHGCDFPDFSNYTSEFLWCREAVLWMLAKLPEVRTCSQ